MTGTPTFPVLALGPDRYTGDASKERFYQFADMASLTRVTRREQQAGARPRWDLIDNDGRSFRIARETASRTLTPLWERVLMTVLRQREAISDLVEIEFSLPTVVEFEGVKARVWASITCNQQEWDDEEPALEAGRTPQRLAKVVRKAKVAIDGATNVESLFTRLKEAWPT